MAPTQLALEEYCRAVNALAQAYCDAINAEQPPRMFGAHHHEYPPSMLRYYYDLGATPEEAFRDIQQDKGL